MEMSISENVQHFSLTLSLICMYSVMTDMGGGDSLLIAYNLLLA